MDGNELFDLGKGIYEQFLKYPDVQFILCPASLGDTLMIGLYLSAYKKYAKKSKVILVIKQHHEDLVKMFPNVDDYFVLSDLECWALRVYIAAMNLYDDNNVLYGHFMVEGVDFSRYKRERLLDFVDEYKAYILKIPMDSETDELNIPQYELKEQYKDAILLMPFCQGYWKCEDTFWKMIIDRFKKAGFNKIYTNVGNPSDYVLEGTEACCLSVSELLFQSEQFKRIIGIRSGIFDILATRSDIDLDVITSGIETVQYGKCEIDTEKHPLYFGLKHLNPTAKVREYFYCKGNDEKLVNEILNN